MAELLTKIYKRNLFYQQVDFKWRSYVYCRTTVRALRLGNAHWLRKTLVTSVFLLVYLIDFALGCIAALVVQRLSLQPWVDHGVSTYTLTMLRWTKDLVTWLMGIPAGLKLNTALDHFLGIRLLSILELWDLFYADFIATYMNLIVSIILLTSLFGVTILLSILHDFLKFLSLCLICFLVVTFRVFSLQVSALKSLARLFMGKKWNVLRRRVDSCDYDTSQLLMGTVLFTVLLFLLPTTGMYFVIFLLLRMMQFTVQFILRTGTVLVNKLIVECWRFLHLSMKDEPISCLKVTLGACGEEKGGNEAFVTVKVKWNGKEYSVEEVRDLLESYPPAKALAELSGEAGGGTLGNEMQSHSMLNWIGGLPLQDEVI